MLIENNILCKVDENLDTIIIPEGVRKIQKYAFSSVKCNKIILPNSLEEIEPLSFTFCTVKEINIPDNTKLYHDSFFECPNLKNIIISDKKYSEIKSSMQKFFGYCDISINKDVQTCCV